MKHFPAYGVAPDYWAQRALGSNYALEKGSAAGFASERLLACESLLFEREQATAQAERRNANREKQLQDHTVKLDEYRAQLEAAYARIQQGQVAQRAKAADLKRWEDGLLQREENLKLLLSSPQGALLQFGGHSGQPSLDRTLDARPISDGSLPRPQQHPHPQQPTPPQAQVHEQRSHLKSLKTLGPPSQVAAGAASPFSVRTPRSPRSLPAGSGVAAEVAEQEEAVVEEMAAQEAEEAASAAGRELEQRARAGANTEEEKARLEAVEGGCSEEERAAAAASQADAHMGVERSPPPPPTAPEGKGRPRSRQLPQARSSYDVQGEGSGPADNMGMIRCSQCGRSFAEDRIEQHERACRAQSAAQPRKVFDAARGRRAHIIEAGGDQGGRPDTSKARSKEHGGDGEPKWKAESENLRTVMNYNRQLAAAQKAGRNISTLPPPPKQMHDDRVACPHCNRKFNAEVAERHIPKCNSRPK